MPRHLSTRLLAAAVLLLSICSLRADPPEPVSLETTLALQKAMVMARAYLRMDDPKKAVEVLEQHLARVNGHTAYLELLRDAYRAYIKDLGLKSQAQAAQRYLQRLIILDPTAVNDPTLRPNDPPIFVPPAPKDPGPALPDFKATQTKAVAPPPRIDVTPEASAVKAPIVRAIMEDPRDDPFDDSHERIAPNRIAAVDPSQARAMLAKGNQEFEKRRYAEARACYEQCVKLDGKNADRVRDRLAYCLLHGADEQLSRPGTAPLPEIRKQVTTAIAMAPQLKDTGAWLLDKIDRRDRTAVAGSTPDVEPPIAMQHFGKNPQGWQVTETANFRVFHNQNRDLVERVATIAERTRLAMSRKWFGVDGETWSPKCEIVLHANGADYSRLTGVPATSPGHSRIETDPATLRVIGRRIDLHADTMGMLEAVLPHETTHVVLAGQFGGHQVPRWADEGVAVLTEPTEKIEQHRRNLSKCRAEGTLTPLRDLMALQNYPEAKQISAFYAQSVVLVDFLAQQRGPQVFTEFLREGLQNGYEPSLRKHYGWSHADLQSHFNQHIGLGKQTASAGR